MAHTVVTSRDAPDIRLAGYPCLFLYPAGYRIWQPVIRPDIRLSKKPVIRLNIQLGKNIYSKYSLQHSPIIRLHVTSANLI